MSNIDDLIQLLEEKKSQDDRKVETVCLALIYGIRTNRATYNLERALLDDLSRTLDLIIQAWDGQDHIAGALYAANELFRRR